MSSGFISESEIAEQRRKRQEEWDKVRSDDQPEEAPEEPYDSRSLFDRLEEQKQKRDHDFEEAHKLKNMIKGLDDDEVDFLDLVDRTKLQVERQQNLEEALELQDYRNQVASLQEKTMDKRIQVEIGNHKPKIAISANRISQKKILAGVVVKKRKLSDDIEIQIDNKPTEPKKGNEPLSEKNSSSSNKGIQIDNKETEPKRGNEHLLEKNSSNGNKGMQCIGILPGLGAYDDSSDSEDSSGSEEGSDYDRNKFDLLGRKRSCKINQIKNG